MAASEVAGSDFARLSSEQRGRVRAALGNQGGANVPFTSARVATDVYRFWQNMLEPVIIAADEEGKAIPAQALIAAAGMNLVAVGGFVMPISGPSTISLATHLRSSSQIGVKDAGVKIEKALLNMASALAGGFITSNASGVKCMNLSNATRFWDGVSTLAIQYGFLCSRISIGAGEFLEAALDGAREGAENVAKTIGEAAGKAAGFAGDLAGKAGSGFLSGLGLANTAILLGGGVLVAKTVF